MKRALTIAGLVLATFAIFAMFGSYNARALRSAFPQTQHPSREAVFGNRPVVNFALGGALVRYKDLLRQRLFHSQKGSRVFAPYPAAFGPTLAGFRYSGTRRLAGATPAANSMGIKLNSLTFSGTQDHVAAWQGVQGESRACNGHTCNWMQAGVEQGIGCFGVGYVNQRWTYVEVVYNGGGIPTNGACPANGSYFVSGGAMAGNVKVTVDSYMCANVNGCNYDALDCNGLRGWNSSYRRGALRMNGCMLVSNVYLDDPASGSRHIVGTLEAASIEGAQTSGNASFTNSTYPFDYRDTPLSPGDCLSGGDAFNWTGCLGLYP